MKSKKCLERHRVWLRFPGGREKLWTPKTAGFLKPERSANPLEWRFDSLEPHPKRTCIAFSETERSERESRINVFWFKNQCNVRTHTVTHWVSALETYLPLEGCGSPVVSGLTREIALRFRSKNAISSIRRATRSTAGAISPFSSWTAARIEYDGLPCTGA